MGGVEARKAPAPGRANSGIVASSLRNAPHPGPLPAGGERESAPRTEHSVRRGVEALPPRALSPFDGERDRVRGESRWGEAERRQNWTRWVSAPSMMRLVPVIKLARGLARNTTALATSSGVPMRPIGFLASIEANISGLRSSTMFHTPPLKYTLPGETIFARTFFAARLRARPFT